MQKLIDLANAYGVDASSFDKDLSLEQYILNQFHGKPVVGDQVKLDFICEVPNMLSIVIVQAEFPCSLILIS